jgi:hypothetical protein
MNDHWLEEQDTRAVTDKFSSRIKSRIILLIYSGVYWKAPDSGTRRTKKY